MLVLSRKLGESVKIGDDVVVTVVYVDRVRIKLGIEAPRDVSVVRSELINREPPAREEPVVGSPD